MQNVRQNTITLVKMFLLGDEYYNILVDYKSAHFFSVY